MAQSQSEASISAEDVPTEEVWNELLISEDSVLAEADWKAFSVFESASTTEEWKTWIESFPQRNLGSKLDSRIWSMLNDHLVEKIISRLSFKALFRVSSLSKTWRDRLRSQLFQSEVQYTSPISWDSYSPVFVDRKKDLRGFETSSKRWHRLPSHSYIPACVIFDWELKAGAGSLLCWTCRLEHVFHIHVTNPLSKSWKRLPSRPKMEYPEYVHMELEGGSSGYRVVVPVLGVSQSPLDIHVQIFDSSSALWTVESYETGIYCGAVWGGSALINGVLYMLVFTLDRRPVHQLISFDLKEKVWKELPLVYQFSDGDKKANQHTRLYEIHSSEVLVCQSNVILAMFHTSIWDKALNQDLNFYKRRSRREEESSVMISLFRLDLECGLASEVYIPPQVMFRILHYPWESAQLMLIGDCIYIRPLKTLSPMIHYNVATEEWHWVSYATDSPASFCGAPVPRCTTITYHPGLNPFLEV